MTGAYLGTPLSFIAMGVYCCAPAAPARRARSTDEPLAVASSEPPPAALSLWAHVKRAWAPIAGLIIIAVLQNIDIIAAKHRFSTRVASSYSAVAVAAKVLIWVAMGAGFYLVPEVSRRRAEGEDPRPILARALGIVAVCAIPVLLIFAFALAPAHQGGVRRVQDGGGDSLLVLGLAFTVLACTYLAIQYMLALRRTWFLVAARRGGGRRADPAAQRVARAQELRRGRAGDPGRRQPSWPSASRCARIARRRRLPAHPGAVAEERVPEPV